MFLLLICLTGSLNAEKAVLRIPNPAAGLARTFDAQHYDIASYVPGEYLDLVLPLEQISGLQQRFPGSYISQTEEQLQANLHGEDRTLPGYRSYATMVADLNAIANNYPNLTQLVDLGASQAGIYHDAGYPAYANYDHHLWAVKLSDNPTVEEDEPCFFFMGNFHAREPLGVETTMAILNDLLSNYQTDPAVQNLVNNAQIWFVPSVNPDGHEVVWNQIDTWWRKNLRDNNGNHAFDTDNNQGLGADGVDLNRNFGFEWGYMSATDDPGYVTYHGPSPFSEVEAQIIRDLLLSHHYLAGISFHTYSQLVLYPFGYVDNISAPDTQELAALASQMALAFPAQGGGYYTPEASWVLYPASGGLDDWAYGERGIFCYTIEMSTQFIPSQTTVNLVCTRVKPVARFLLNRMNRSLLKGHVTDAVSGEPMIATIHVQGLDDMPTLRTPYQSDAEFGSYYRFLPAGTYTVRYTTEGWLPYETEVTITADSVTVQDVQLTPAQVVTLNGWVSTFGDMPVEGASVEFLQTSLPIAITDANGNFTVADFPYGYYTIRISKPGFETVEYSQTIASDYLAFLISDAPSVLYDFETNISGWTTNGTWNVTTNFAHSGLRSLNDRPNLNYQDNTDSWIKLAQPFNLAGQQNACISFFLKTFLVLDGDNCLLEYSTNGNTWLVMDYYTGITDWTEKTYSLNQFLGQNLYLRFHLLSTDSGAAQGVFIDDFRYYCSGMVVSGEQQVNPPVLSSLSVYPNPVFQTSRLQVSLSGKGVHRVQLQIFNIKGQLVKNLLKEDLSEGNRMVEWNCRDYRNQSVSAGVYFVRLTVDGVCVRNRKILVVK